MALIIEPDNTLLRSAASSWEITKMYALGKLQLLDAPMGYVNSRVSRSGTTALAITHGHALQVANLPQHHRYPFDRLLVAQPQLGSATRVTSVTQLDQYDVSILSA